MEGWTIPVYEGFSSEGLSVHAGPPLIPMNVHVVAHVKTTVVAQAPGNLAALFV